MRTQSCLSLPKLTGAFCIALTALLGCGSDESGNSSADNNSTSTTGAQGGSGSQSASTGQGGGQGGEGTSAGQGGQGGQGGEGTSAGQGGESTSAGQGGQGGGGGGGNGAKVRFIGRFDMTDPAAPRFSFPGTAIATRFTGTSIRVRMKDTPISGPSDFFQVVIDGESKGVLEVNKDKELYTVAEGLPDGTHDLLLHRRTEGLVGVTQFLGFVVDEGEELLPPAPAPNRRIEIIGDSISAGYGIDGPDETCTFSAQTENNYLAYSAMTARLLGADASIIAWSGIGAYRNYDGTPDTMPRVYGRTIHNEATPAWDFSSWVPHVVVINLGTNDFNAGNPGQPFVDAYAKLVETVRSKYPEAIIFCAVGPMLSDSYPEGAMALTNARTYIRRVVDDRTAAGDTRMRFIEFTQHDKAKDGLGCDWHPSAKKNAEMAQQLAEAIRKETGWR